MYLSSAKARRRRLGEAQSRRSFMKLKKASRLFTFLLACTSQATRTTDAFSSKTPPPTKKTSTSSFDLEEVTNKFAKRLLRGQQWVNDAATAGGGRTTKSETILEKLSIEANAEPRPLQVAKGQLLDIATSSVQFLLRGGSGAFALGYNLELTAVQPNAYCLRIPGGKYMIRESCANCIIAKPPREPIELYEFEACPFCRKVREAVSILSLDVIFKPCPKNGPRFRREVKLKFGDSATFPLMFDPNTGIEMFESDNIISYLFKAYGDGTVPLQLRMGPVTTSTAVLGLLPRFGRGGSFRTSNPPEKTLVLWSYEPSPFCKVVKETLAELEIEHIQISCPRGSPNRQKLLDKMGRFQVPFLEDPNEDDNGGGEGGVQLFESAAIVEYLVKRYGVKSPVVNYI